MIYKRDIHHRRSIRLKDYDYTQVGAYFVTICAWQRECLFGEVAAGKMLLNNFGEMVHVDWNALINYYDRVVMDEFIVMPNHVHGIIVLVGAKFIAPLFRRGRSVIADKCIYNRNVWYICRGEIYHALSPCAHSYATRYRQARGSNRAR